MLARILAVLAVLLFAGAAWANPLMGSWTSEDETQGLRFEEQQVTVNHGGERITYSYRTTSIVGDRVTVSILEPGSRTKTTSVLFRVNGSDLRMTNPESGLVESFVRVADTPADQAR